MNKELKEGLLGVSISGILAVAFIGILSITPVVTANAKISLTENASEEAKYEYAVETNEEAFQAAYVEANKPENQTVGGQKSDVPGYYLAQKVDGVALKTSEGTNKSDTYVGVCDADPKKSTLAMNSINNIAAGNGLTVGPTIDLYLRSKTAKGYTDGSIATIDDVKIGIPGNFAGASSYTLVAVFPGGVTATQTVAPSADNKSVTFDMKAFREANPGLDFSQATIALCK